MISKSEVRPGNGWRYLFRGVMVGDGHRLAGTPLRAAQDEAGVPPGVWKGRGLAALGLTDGDVVTERQAELLLDGHLRLLTEDHNARRACDGYGDRSLITACLGGARSDEETERVWGHPAVEYLSGPARPGGCSWLPAVRTSPTRTPTAPSGACTS
ncbi:hypothetical protein [Streptomyces sp. enrichment culture]|uniref:hypothetical protein n=1 Tax=Streptomyces sp. enrichment culture TaxID=1795815 RepID=UPI003F57709F